MPARRVLVIEDDAAIRKGIVGALRFEGYQPLQAATYTDGLDAAIRAAFDLLLLDLVLPGGDGLQILEEARRSRPTLPVIILTARGAEQDRVRGLKLGADDYVTKPFSAQELLARVEAVLRRSAERSAHQSTVHFAGGRVDLEAGEVRLGNGESATLSGRELELLRYLAGAQGLPVSRDELLQRIWKLTPSAIQTRTVDMHVMRLREKLGDDGEAPAIILTVRGKGYRLVHT